MGMKETLSKKRIADGFKAFGKLRIHISHSSILLMFALFLVIFIAFSIRLMPMRWEIPNGSLALGEFDPYYQFSLTRHMVQNGLLSPYYPAPWITPQQWYPFGLDMSGSLPTLPLIAAVSYDVVTFLGVKVDLMTYCSFLPVILGTLAVLALYFAGKDMGGKAVGLLAALILALSPMSLPAK